MTLGEQKRALRTASGARRRLVSAAAGADAGDRAAHHFRASIPTPAGATVSGYWPFRDEIDPWPLLNALHAAGHVIALPVVVAQGEPLMFRIWRPGMALVTSTYGVSEPPPEARAVVPDVVIAPLLAFDRQGYRLGYGGGYYDRTLAALRGAKRPLLAVGMAYAAQEVDAVPHGPADERLDWVVSEQEARRMA